MTRSAVRAGGTKSRPHTRGRWILASLLVATAAVGVPLAFLIRALVIDLGRRNQVFVLQVVAGDLAWFGALLFVASYFRCDTPTGWLVHLTSPDARDAMTAHQPPGIIDLRARSRQGKRRLLADAHLRRDCIYFFDRPPPRRWCQFNLSPDRRNVAIWVRSVDLAAHDPRFLRRHLLDKALAWPGGVYRGPAIIEAASALDCQVNFGPTTFDLPDVSMP